MKLLLAVFLLAATGSCIKTDQYDLVYSIPGVIEEFTVNTIPLSREECEISLIEMNRISTDFNYKCVGPE